MPNIRPNSWAGLRAARHFRRATHAPLPAQVEYRVQPFFKVGLGHMITTTCLGTAFLYWIDYKSLRTRYNAKLASDKEFERKLKEFDARELAWKAEMEAEEEELATFLHMVRAKADNVPHDA